VVKATKVRGVGVGGAMRSQSAPGIVINFNSRMPKSLAMDVTSPPSSQALN